MLVWKGKIIEKIDTGCKHGDYLCEFSCHILRSKHSILMPEPSFRVLVCAQLFTERNGDDVEIPMEFEMDGRVYSPATEPTPVSKPA